MLHFMNYCNSVVIRLNTDSLRPRFNLKTYYVPQSFLVISTILNITGIAMLSNGEIEKNIREELDNKWELKDGKLVKLLQFSSFMNAIYFVNDVAKVAEKLQHHPIITINWKTVRVSLKSFDVDAITKRDISLAKEINDIQNEKLQ
jgi:4a-hydroxytetrahydrobiopterin dehydratase